MLSNRGSAGARNLQELFENNEKYSRYEISIKCIHGSGENVIKRPINRMGVRKARQLTMTLLREIEAKNPSSMYSYSYTKID